MYVFIADVGRLLKDDSKEMIFSAQNSHDWYPQELDKKNILERKTKKLENRRERDAEEIKEINSEKSKIQQDADKKIAKWSYERTSRLNLYMSRIKIIYISVYVCKKDLKFFLSFIYLHLTISMKLHIEIYQMKV